MGSSLPCNTKMSGCTRDNVSNTVGDPLSSRSVSSRRRRQPALGTRPRERSGCAVWLGERVAYRYLHLQGDEYILNNVGVPRLSRRETEDARYITCPIERSNSDHSKSLLPGRAIWASPQTKRQREYRGCKGRESNRLISLEICKRRGGVR